jgi:hypothetical protein
MKAKVFILTLLLSVLPFRACIADGVRFLIVNGKDGTQTSFALTEEPRISCKDGELVVASHSRTFTLSLDGVRNYLFSDELTGIDEVQTESKIQLTDGHVVFSGLKSGDKVSVFMHDGRLVKESEVDVNGSAVVTLSDLPRGILIVHSNETNIKIINR